MKINRLWRVISIFAVAAILAFTIPTNVVLAAEDLTLDPVEGYIGTSVEVDGDGFDESDFGVPNNEGLVYVDLYFSPDVADTGDEIGNEVDTYQRVVSGILIDSNGDFDAPASFDVPSALTHGTDDEDVSSGTYYVYATYTDDASNNIVAIASFELIGGEISLWPDDGPVGEEVGIDGDNFKPSETISIEYDGDAIAIESGDTSADVSGNFDSIIIIPESTAGEHVVTVTGDQGSEADAVFTVEPIIYTEDGSWIIGDEVGIWGTGFAGEVNVDIYFDGNNITTIPTDENGSFAGSFIVPEVALGDYIVEAEDEDANTDNTEFEVEASVRVSVLPASQEVQFDEAFSVDIYVEPRVPVSGIQLDLRYTPPQVNAPSYLSLVDVVEGDLLSQDGAATYFYPGNNVDGYVRDMVGVIITPGESITTAGVLGTIGFEAERIDNDKLSFVLSNVLVTDSLGNVLPVAVEYAHVTIVPYPEWDINSDGVLDILDITLVSQHCGETGTPGWIPEDVNEDGVINQADIFFLINRGGVVPNQPPVADPNGPYSGTENISLSFDGSGSYDLGGTITSYNWDFGDGNSGSGVSPTHTYVDGGTYTVTLTVEDDDGATDAESTTATIAEVNDPPIADPNGPYSASTGETVTFDGSGSSDEEGPIASYNWDFGDGNFGSGVNPTHSYSTAGIYTVTLTVNDGSLDSTPVSTTAVIADVPDEPVELFFDSFEDGLANWSQDSQNDWLTSTQRSADGSHSAEIDGSASDATLTLNDSIDLSGSSGATLTFSWFIERSVDSGEYLALDLWNGTAWIEAAQLQGNVDTENIWHDEVIDLSSYLVSDFRLRFRGTMSTSWEDANLDIVRIMG